MNAGYSDVVLLVQFSQKIESRTFVEYKSLKLALNGICQLYEQAIKENDPSVQRITYNMNDLFLYIDNIPKITILLFHTPTFTYKPHDKIWIKQKLVDHIKDQIGK
ncbi:enhancer of rudimentary-like protein [Plasmodium gaboni]|uniref:Enhancer of rudimentary homolog n=1 Tax=Plasmodium gaboni TaxID=647221 RepID=A0A151LLG6_9APIC|nr:enhancer of rudimentary-like protein [Plasmodium gaboni]XP_028538723.1 enhancer of rudimentary homolog, putative [Plasmodium sp. gorilla clade G2]SOV23106.1 enhancer of rudimentary homolog, putative [Plasmodium sp. DRC-Itaito]KYN99746.1 enhancer of rudimentary-like protein [Plasmodium gaboni]SOV15211.1 enhancer of rudimentary homolog, putative [Plasmodium gaboni]SOV15254.1 enhancer of rudimentary homolog, putative [Plasmodium sp. gorilla clade G2]